MPGVQKCSMQMRLRHGLDANALALEVRESESPCHRSAGLTREARQRFLDTRVVRQLDPKRLHQGLP
jgi:hypothetical protein